MDGPGIPAAEVLSLLRGTALGAEASSETLAVLGAGARRAVARSGDTIFHHGDQATTAYVLLSGRVQFVATDRFGAETILGYLGPGEVFGAASMFESGRRSVTAIAADACDLLAVDGDALFRAVAASKQLAFDLLAGFGRQMKQAMNLHRGDKPATRVAVIRDRRGEGLVDALAAGIAGYGLAVHRHRSGPATGSPGGDLPPGTRRLTEWVSDGLTFPPLDYLTDYDRVLWVIPADARAEAEKSFREALAGNPVLAEKARIVWLLAPGERVGPPSPAVRDFKVPAPGAGRPDAVDRRAVGRVVRDVLGLRRGLALSGGGAKGMAHLGVLRALDRAGIDFDLMAGTSGGALAGVPVAAGHDPDFCVTSFARDLTTPWHFRRLPRGKNLFLLWCFRAGRFDAMLRPYLHRWGLDQLPVPFSALTVDLVTGREVVRDAGDAVHAILESINVPGIAAPIVRGDQALTDGGVLNNLPSDVLVAKGAGFVVGVDVTRRMRAESAGLTPGHPAAARPGSVETMFRVLEVLSSATNGQHVRAADLMIEPDTTTFGFADFDRTAALADAGERAAEEALPRLRDALAAFERRVLAG